MTVDFTGDGHADIAAIDENTVHIFSGNGDGAFTKTVEHFVGGVCLPGKSVDVNGDCTPDIIMPQNPISGYPGKISVFIGNGDGTFKVFPHYQIKSAPSRQSLKFQTDPSIRRAKQMCCMGKGFINVEWYLKQ